jgi:hypothetical protein
MKRLWAWVRQQRSSDWAYYGVMTFYLLFFVYLLSGWWA